MSSKQTFRMSWSRDEDGVIVIYGTRPDGRISPIADIWLKPLMDRFELPRPKALAEQQRIAEALVSMWNHNDEISVGGAHE